MLCGLVGPFRLQKGLAYPDRQEDPKSRSPDSELWYSYGVDYRTLRWIYFLDPPRGRSSWVLGPYPDDDRDPARLYIPKL